MDRDLVLDVDPLADTDDIEEAGYLEEQELLDMMLAQKIHGRGGELVQFKPWPHQERIMDRVFYYVRNHLPIRLIICKARQLGCSTLFAIFMFCWITALKRRKAMLAAHCIQAAQEVYDTAQILYDNQPASQYKPLSHRSIRGFAYEAPHYSRLVLNTANNPHLGRAGRINYVHVTELAMWQNPKKPMAALYQCIPPQADTMMCQESTALGPGNYFHSQFRAASEKLIETEALFVDWKDFPYYSYPPVKDLKKKVTQIELDYINEFKLDKGQATWYVNTLRQQCGNDHEVFDREFPMTAERAFAASGEGWFDFKTLQFMMRPEKEGGMFFEPKFIGDISWDLKETDANSSDSPIMSVEGLGFGDSQSQGDDT